MRSLAVCLAGLVSLRAAAAQVVTIFTPQLNWWAPGLEYARILQQVHSNSSYLALLATCEKMGVDNGLSTLSFPIFRSVDYGATWLRIADVTTPDNGGMTWEPQLFELPTTIGSLPAGTLLCGGLSYTPGVGILKLFQSSDNGYTWNFMSNIATGGAPGQGVWEPFFLVSAAGQLVVFYSDERQFAVHAQMIVHQVSPDEGYTWGPVVQDIAVADQSLRPGMASVSRLPSGDFFMTYEVVGMAGNPVHFRFSPDGTDWGDSTFIGTQLTSDDGVTPGSAPYNVWSPAGGPNGQLIVSADFQTPPSPRGSDFFVNYDLGKGPWKRVAQPLPYTNTGTTRNGYSHGMVVSEDGHTLYAVNNVNFNDSLGLSQLAFAPLYLGP